MQNEIPIDNDTDNLDETGSDAGAAADAAVTDAEEIGPLEAQRERYMRLAAEFDNYRKRTAREAQQARARGQGDLIKMILDSLDDLSRFAHVDPATADCATLVTGVEMVEKNVMKALTSVGVEVIDPVGLPFDPNLHEAVSTQAAESPDEDHMVAQVYQRGYLLNGQLLRPARVVVKQYQ
ncbi:MAG TPA: nucleotide exchange factor GrpE [Gemmatimonadaceae bacterium]